MGTGFADLVMSAPFRHVGDETGAGRAYVLYGSAERGAAGFVRRIDRITQNGAGRDEADDHFGMALAVGDFNGDGYQDLAIGAPDEDDNSNNRANSGAVFIRYGSAGGLTSTDYHYVTAATRSVTTGENPTKQANGLVRVTQPARYIRLCLVAWTTSWSALLTKIS